MNHDDIEAMIVNKITLGTRRQYAEQSKAWQNGDGRSEDQLLQRIWNLADDTVSLIDFIHALVTERDEAIRDGAAAISKLIDRAEAAEVELRSCELAYENAHERARVQWVRAEAAEDQLEAHIASRLNGRHGYAGGDNCPACESDRRALATADLQANSKPDQNLELARLQIALREEKVRAEAAGEVPSISRAVESLASGSEGAKADPTVCPVFGEARSHSSCEVCGGNIIDCPVYGPGERRRIAEASGSEGERT